MPSLDSERPLDGGFQGEDTLPRCKQQRPVFNDNQSVNSRPRWAVSRACPGCSRVETKLSSGSLVRKHSPIPGSESGL